VFDVDELLSELSFLFICLTKVFCFNVSLVLDFVLFLLSSIESESEELLFEFYFFFVCLAEIFSLTEVFLFSFSVISAYDELLFKPGEF
jgi:hypothetical protein